MEEITTRFEIVRLAVQLGDFRTIDLQCEKLRALSLDDKLNEIIDLLESRNYRQALYEMKHYARSLEDEFFAERERQNAPEKFSRTVAADRGLFDLGEAPEEEDEERVLDLDEILRLSKKRTAPPSEEYRPAPALEPTSPDEEEREAAPERSEERAPAPEKEPLEFFEGREEAVENFHPEEEEAERFASQPVEEVEREEGASFEMEAEVPAASDIEKAPPAIAAEAELKDTMAPTSREEPGTARGPVDRPAPRVAPAKPKGAESAASETRHPPISYISQKFRNMMHQFPPVEREAPIPEEVERMQKKIASEGYTDEEIEAFLKHYLRYKEKGKRAEAAMVLLLAAATESKFAQFLLARELFRGEILRQDHAEAFTQINTLADQNFAEAICDLGQFYEHGVGIGKDRQMALLLYEEAAEMGVERARRHYERLKNSRGLLGVFKKVSLPKVSIPLPKKK